MLLLHSTLVLGLIASTIASPSILDMSKLKGGGSSWGLMPRLRTGRSQTDKTWLIEPQEYAGIEEKPSFKRGGGSWRFIPVPRMISPDYFGPYDITPRLGREQDEEAYEDHKTV